MRISLIKIVTRSLVYHRKDTILLVIIIALLSAIITGSLISGDSVRSSLRKIVEERIGNTDILISSGFRYFDKSLAERISAVSGANSVPLLETDGFCQNFSTGATVLNTNIYAVDDSFFPFLSRQQIKIEQGTAAVNSTIASHLGIKTGDEIIIHFKKTDPLPENAPFAPSKENSGSIVLKVGAIISPEQGGDFSTAVSQVTPSNIFINRSEITDPDTGTDKANRILIANKNIKYSDTSFFRLLKADLNPENIGLKFRKSVKTGETEIISDRIFIDSAIAGNITLLVKGSYPVLTYLGNSFANSKKTSPYSFISAIPGLSGEVNDNEVLINQWLANDLGSGPGDTLKISWFDPAGGKTLKEKTAKFIVRNIVKDNSPLLDSLLMPDFPGISGSTTCAGWDAGVPLNLDRIRVKDEEYWNRYRGTPKAFVNYNTGKRLWGNNFGPATAIRFSAGIDSAYIKAALKDRINPSDAGFTVTDLRTSNLNSADKGVDFSTLLLCLGIFMIVSCIVLVSILLSLYLDSRSDEIRAYFSIGFRNSHILKLLFCETGTIFFTSALAGILGGYLITLVMIKALNSVWYGAVQMNTITPVFTFKPVFEGFLITIFISCILLYLKLTRFLKIRTEEKYKKTNKRPLRNNLYLTLILTGSFGVIFLLSIFSEKHAVLLSFLAGTLLFATMMMMLRIYFVKAKKMNGNRYANYSRAYFNFHPSQALSPALFVAAGIFALSVTGSNRQHLTEKMLERKGGTGGFDIWAESAIPVKENLSVATGRKEFGFDEADLKDVKFISIKRVKGDDASCLNLNHVTSPALLGVDPSEFISRGAFSFASGIREAKGKSAWEMLNIQAGNNTIYGIADQTVLEWSLRLKPGDTLKYRSEAGQTLNIIISAGLRSSLFQGYLIISNDNLEKFFPSVSGSSVFLVESGRDKASFVTEIMNERMSSYGIESISAGEKLGSFFTVTNTYIEVFMVLGILGLILGSAGFGLVMLRNFNIRKREFALLTALGYPGRRIKNILLRDQVVVLVWGVMTGLLSALVASRASAVSGAEIPYLNLSLMVILILVTGVIVLWAAVNQVTGETLIGQLRRE